MAKPRPETRPLDGKAINTLLRACIRAPKGMRLLVCDWSQVEARFLAWAAEDRDALKRFALFDAGDKINGDPYAAAAATIYGGSISNYPKGTPERQVGKSAELGCQYQMGAQRFHDYALENGADWNALAPITAFDVVKAWRKLHAPIVSFWYALQDAAIEATYGNGEQDVGPFTMAKIEGLICMRLPSGRLIAYQGMTVGERIDARGRKRPSLRYISRKGPEHTFGGKLTENAIQGGSNCLLRRALVECERVGLEPVLTIHDEIVCQVPERDADEGLACLKEIMCEVPPWADGLPLAAEGFHCDRYRKE